MTGDIQFILTTHAGTFTLPISPDGWDESLITWERSDKYWGVFRSWTIPLRFVKTGATEIRREFYTYGMKSLASIVINKRNKVTEQYFITFAGTLDFATFRDEDYFVEVSFIDSGAAKILKDYGGNEYQIGNGQADSYGFTSDVIFKGSGDYYGSELLHVAISLFDLMSDGKVIGLSPDISLRSDYLENYTYQTSSQKIIMVPGVQFRTVGNKSGYFRTSFDDWFQSVSSIFNLGLGIEYDAQGKEVIRIEPKSYFFSFGITEDFGSVKNIAVSMAAKYTFKRLKIGYPAQDYENNKTHGHKEDEVNATSYWEVKNEISGGELDLVSKYRGDGFGFEDIMHELHDTNDEDIFFVQVYDEAGTGYHIDDRGTAQLTNEADDEYYIYNSLITPRRNLTRWYDFLSSCFFGMQAEQLKCTAADNEIMFRKSSITGGTLEEESAPWTIGYPDWFFPVIFEIETAAASDLIASVMANPTGLYQFDYAGTNYICHILKIEARVAGRSSQKMTFLANASTGFATLIERKI